MRKYLVDEAHDGDVLLFYYAGHGSQVRNSLSYKPDKQDETIVPWDANVGAWDIRDKEIARLFNEALDKHKVTLTAIFDSCHSGSVARGLAGVQLKTRSIAEAIRDAKDDYHATPPEDRGALILSAAQFNENAKEAVEQHDGAAISHGAFTLALLQTFNRVPPNTPARDVFRITRLALHSLGSTQEPVIAGNEDRSARGLFGEISGSSGPPKVFVQEIRPDGKIVIDGGYSIGLERNAELKHASKAIRLRVVEVTGLSSSVAELIDKTANSASIQKGDAFEIDRWAFPGGATLAVWLPAAMPLKDVVQAAAVFTRLQERPGLTWVQDPTEVTPTHIIRWTGKTWELRAPTKILDLGSNPTEEFLSAQLQAEGKVSLFVDLPPPAELVNNLPLGPDSENSAIDVAGDPAKSKYWLVGRINGSAMEYVWLQPNASRDPSSPGDAPLPVRSDWLAVEETSIAKISGQLIGHLQGIARIVSWMTLPAPPEEKEFPYQLALRDTETGQWITGTELQTAAGTMADKSSRIATTAVTGGQNLQLVLKADPNKLKGYQEPRKVYVFGMDSFGRCRLLFPHGADDQRNRMPDKDDDGKYPTEVPVSEIRVNAPWGVDSYIMLTTMKPMSDLTVFNCEPVRTRGAIPDNPLANLLQRTRSLARGGTDGTPADWSIQRLPVLSVASKK
jgi:broad specificity phosphatase PhoE